MGSIILYSETWKSQWIKYLVTLCLKYFTQLEPEWIAPEILKTGKTEKPEYADVYSFGMLLFEMTTR